MKRKLTAVSVMILAGVLLLWGCATVWQLRDPIGGGKEQNGPLGTLQTAMEAAEKDGVLYFLYPVGPVTKPTGVAAYDLKTERFYQLEGLPGKAVQGFCLGGDDMYLMTEETVYQYDLQDGRLSVLRQADPEKDALLTFLFWEKDHLILSQSWWEAAEESGTETYWTEIIQLLPDGTEQSLWKGDSRPSWHPARTCYWDGKLYDCLLGEKTIYELDLSQGTLTEREAVGSLERGLYSDAQGVMLQTSGDETIYRLDGSVYAEAPKGGLVGCGKAGSYYLCPQSSGHGIYRLKDGVTETLWEDFETDMVTEPAAYVAEDHVLFYSPSVLVGEGQRDAWVHSLYLLTEDGVKLVTTYRQDFFGRSRCRRWWSSHWPCRTSRCRRTGRWPHTPFSRYALENR